MLTAESANQLYFGDCLDVMRENIPDSSIKLIYLDPPFNSNPPYRGQTLKVNGTICVIQYRGLHRR